MVLRSLSVTDGNNRYIFVNKSALFRDTWGRGILCDDKEEYVIRFESISRFCHIHHIKQNKAVINLEKWLTY